jgi:hypothetical protein
MRNTLPSKTDPCDSITTYPDRRMNLYEADVLMRCQVDIDPIVSLRQPRMPTF